MAPLPRLRLPRGVANTRLSPGMAPPARRPVHRPVFRADG
jgi:hypothetical protein